jgi:hypothetical protein
MASDAQKVQHALAALAPNIEACREECIQMVYTCTFGLRNRVVLGGFIADDKSDNG